ncbi:anti-anti-sigma factor [Peribacillus simplex]|uniref:anti-anti-sigma factor n=1 Tax=Peribacillus simplex TaxID=1478 RepID=UPI003D2A42CF
MTVLSSYNWEEEIIPEGYSAEYGGTFCRLIIKNKGDAIHTANLMKDAITRELEITGQLNVKGFLGVTFKDLKGNVFGTLCVMDKKEKVFLGEDINYLKSMADILSHMIKLNHYSMGFLSVPIIPITKGTSILSIQGIVDGNRSELIMSDVLHSAADNDIGFFIIDLSKLLVKGVTPSIAKEHVNNFDLKNLKTKMVKGIQYALDYIGYALISNIA